MIKVALSISIYYYLLAAASFFCTYLIFSKWLKGKRMRISSLIAYVVLFFSSTVLARETYTTARIQLVPFWSYTNLAGSFRNGFLAQIVFNILAFVPIGALLMSIIGHRRISFLICMCVSMTIEISQLVLHRGLCEVDDLIHNSIGGFIGINVYVNRTAIMNQLRRARSKIRKWLRIKE